MIMLIASGLVARRSASVPEMISRLPELGEVLVEELHALLLIRDGLGQRLGIAVEQDLAHDRRVPQDLDDRDPILAVVGPRQSLADHRLEIGSDLHEQQVALVGREERDEPLHGLGGVGGVHRRIHHVTGVRRLQGGSHGLGVAQLADQNHVRILTERHAQRLEERPRVAAQLPLRDQRLLGRVDELDGILDRDDPVLAAWC